MEQSDVAQPLIVSGRIFRKCEETTLIQDAFVMKRMRSFGLMKVADEFDLAKGNVEASGEDLIMAAFDSGVIFEVLAGMLVEEGTVWSKTSAMLNADFFSKLTSTEDKTAIYERLSDIMFDFFGSAVAWSKLSQKSSTGSQPKNNGASISEPTTSADPRLTITASGT